MSHEYCKEHRHFDKSHERRCNHLSCGGLCCTQIQGLNVTTRSVKILQDINIHMHCGQISTIIGPNGAGKSTLLKAILGEIKYSGHLYFCSEKNEHYITPKIGYVPQSLAFGKDTPCSVSDLFYACTRKSPVCFKNSNRNTERMFNILNKIQASHLIDRKLSDLSGGELQRILLGLALSPLPNLLLLDEPVSGVDKKGSELFYKIVSDLRENFDLSIIMISHDLSDVYQYSDKVILLNRRILKQGSPKDVFDSPEFKSTFSYFNEKGSNLQFNKCCSEER